MKFNSIIIPFLFVSTVLASSSVFATNVEEEFRICAAAALESQLSESTVIHVDISQVRSAGVSKDPLSGSSVRLELNIADVSTGTDLGDVVCMLGRSGELLSADFKPTYVAMN